MKWFFVGGILLAILVVILEDVDQAARRYLSEHQDGQGRFLRLAQFLVGPSDVWYGYPGGRFGAPLACLLTIGATLSGGAIFVLAIVTWLASLS